MNGNLVPLTRELGANPIPLVKKRILVGRQPDCDIQIPFSNVSSRHCELRFHEGCWVLIDRRSTNGVRVNGDKVERKRLRPGDEITIARKYNFRIDYKPEGDISKRDEKDVIIKKKSAEEEYNVFAQSLLERAGLEKSKADDDFDSSLFEDDADA